MLTRFACGFRLIFNRSGGSTIPVRRPRLLFLRPSNKLYLIVASTAALWLVPWFFHSGTIHVPEPNSANPIQAPLQTGSELRAATAPRLVHRAASRDFNTSLRELGCFLASVLAMDALSAII